MRLVKLRSSAVNEDNKREFIIDAEKVVGVFVDTMFEDLQSCGIVIAGASHPFHAEGTLVDVCLKLGWGEVLTL